MNASTRPSGFGAAAITLAALGLIPATASSADGDRGSRIQNTNVRRLNRFRG